MPVPPKAGRPRLMLEDYVLFFTTRAGQGLNLDHLNQIIHMHGFAKLHNEKKPVIVDLLGSLDLMRPRRSTVTLNAISPPPGAVPAAAAAISTEEATRDIGDLGWRECPVGSLLHVRADGRGTRAPAAAPSPVPLASLPPAPGSTTVKRVSSPSLLVSASSSPLPPALPAPARRKRSVTGTGKAARRTRRRSIMVLLTLPSVEMTISG